MTLPIGLQLYTVREALAQDFDGTLDRLVQAGYVGIETFAAPGKTAPDIGKALKTRLLTVVGAHSALPLGADQQRILDAMQALGTTQIVCPWRPPESFKTEDGIKAVCEELNQANQIARAHGLTLLYHNHDAEFRLVDHERRAYQIMLQYLEATVMLEVDLYWAAVAGCDPAAVLRELGARVGQVHVKDGPLSPTHPMTALGEGHLDYSVILKDLPSGVPWLLVELDECATDMLEAVEKSERYLVEKGFGHGR